MARLREGFAKKKGGRFIARFLASVDAAAATTPKYRVSRGEFNGAEPWLHSLNCQSKRAAEVVDRNLNSKFSITSSRGNNSERGATSEERKVGKRK
jgi:hypothetical protein